jgi:hypothetical protein
MSLYGKPILMLATDLAAGIITEDKIKEELGEGVLNSVLAIGGGMVAGVVVNQALSFLDRNTGIVSDLGSVVDDVFSIFD